MDKMTMNMIAGATLSALLVIFGMNTFVDILYPSGGAPEAPIETAQEAAPAEPSAEPAQSLPVLLAAANVEAGEAQAKKCVACHAFEQGGANKIGPVLHGIVGQQVAAIDGFAYSEALKAYGGAWDYERLACFLRNPKSCVPGTKMAFAGISRETDLANLIVYLRSVSPDAPPLPAAEDAAAPAAPAAQDSATPAAEDGAAPAAQEGAAPAAPAAQEGAAPAAPAAQEGATPAAPAAQEGAASPPGATEAPQAPAAPVAQGSAAPAAQERATPPPAATEAPQAPATPDTAPPNSPAAERGGTTPPPDADGAQAPGQAGPAPGGNPVPPAQPQTNN